MKDYIENLEVIVKTKDIQARLPFKVFLHWLAQIEQDSDVLVTIVYQTLIGELTTLVTLPDLEIYTIIGDDK